MQRIGLTFDEYVELCLTPLPEASSELHAAAEAERDRLFPMTKVAASHYLRSRGYDCRPIMLDALLEQGVVAPSSPDVWSQDDVEAAADHLEACQIFMPYVVMCEAMGCSYANFVRPMRGASVC